MLVVAVVQLEMNKVQVEVVVLDGQMVSQLNQVRVIK